MIYVSEKQLQQVEYLIRQSIMGNHVLFDSQTIKDIFVENRGKTMSEQDAYSVEHHIEKIILLPTLAQKRAYLEHLKRDTFELVVKTYFNIVENSIYDKDGVTH